MFPVNTHLRNTVFSGLAVLFNNASMMVFGALGNLIITDMQKDDPTYTVNAFVGQSINNAVMAISVWFMPSILQKLNAKWSYFIGVALNVLYFFTFLYPSVWTFYFGNFLSGLGYAFALCAGGVIATVNTDDKTICRNSAIHWGLSTSSLIVGNSVAYLTFRNTEHIDKSTRQLLFIAMALANMVALVMVLCIKVIPDPQIDRKPKKSVTNAFVRTVKLCGDNRMQLLLVALVFTGLNMSFSSGIYAVSIGFTKTFEMPAFAMACLSASLVGTGQVCGSIINGIIGSVYKSRSRKPMIIVGAIVLMITFICVILNIPNAATLGETYDVSVIDPPSLPLAMICAFTLGLGDCCFNIHIFSILGDRFRDRVDETFAVVRFFLFFPTAVAFYGASVVGVHVLLAILMTLLIFGSCTFILADRGPIYLK